MSGLAPTAAELSRAYAGRRVLVTGHTGFKGSWLTLWLDSLGAEVTGYALAPAGSPSLYVAAGVDAACTSVLADVRDAANLAAVVREARPELVFHLAAQPLVRASYQAPVETLETNVLGTAHLLEAVRAAGAPCGVVVVTSDKCYENREWAWGYREDEPMGGFDPYSMSKGATELVVSSWRRSFFPPARLASHGVALASARAGNVVGGGDWAEDRIVPDAIRALAAGRPIPVRNPRGVRPWQHVLEPLGGYLLLGARLAPGAPARAAHCEAFNFGPRHEDARTVREVVETLVAAWGGGAWEDRSDPAAPHEAGVLRLSVEKAWARLGWAPRWSFEEGLRRTVEWYRAHAAGAGAPALAELCRAQIRAYLER
ncbi:CDP-glucose 4,6-dehydratase [Anaeromyxobacter sp. PSR-1]|uniref:CDP-glucose 4,6-dehydratase n=1 Tax=Anaeromyxobacter sp. PSR-1 TaxID=1300915 RepID=UPI0005DAFBAE|nr:CDP-glucose 4,6-dehydratase [Anaeromyxobacter sp. PSR-1]GAO01372.1 CDP-glucose 4,6-dehydratase [Anaeromyxobacter sp. PSR-1]